MHLPDKLANINDAQSLVALDNLRVELLGKNGELTAELKKLGAAAPEERKALGAKLNEIKTSLESAIEARKEVLILQEEAAKLENEKIDVTLPVYPTKTGTLHPTTQVLDEIATIFAAQGFSVRHGPLVEDDEHNFTALNFPPSHPARLMHDTFFVREENKEEGEEKYVLRTHTSPVQIRVMRSEQPPIRIIAPGSTFRCDSDQTHTPMFNQIEGLVIDRNINMGHLKHCVSDFLCKFFGIDNLPVRFRPSFFPFTEPSAEVDIGCERGKDGLKIGAGKGWLEIMGCGMVHPNVLRNCGLDPEEWQGFAFGMGVERLAMLKYNIPDLRTFFESDVRWLEHYGFSALNIPGAFGQQLAFGQMGASL